MDGRMTVEDQINMEGVHVGDLTWFAAARCLDPLDDLAPWVPEEFAHYVTDRFQDTVTLAVPAVEIDNVAARIKARLEERLRPLPAIPRVRRVDPTALAGLQAFVEEAGAVAAAPTRSHAISVHPDALRLAGTGLGCVFTVNYADGDHTTYRVNRGMPKDGYPPPPLFAGILTGASNDDPRAYTYIGIVTEPALRVKLTAGSKGPIVAAHWARLDEVLAQIRDGELFDGTLEIRTSENCSRCGRLLTTPESLSLGIGPECRTKEIGQ